MEALLVESLQRQDVGYELKLIDNSSGRYRSAASAFNEVDLTEVRGEHLMFAHQDIRLPSNDWLRSAEILLGTLSQAGIAGVAGKAGKEGVLSNMIHGEPTVPAGRFRLEKTVAVQTVDESLFFIPKVVFESHKFDGRVCDGWHLYAAEYSLSIKKEGREVYVLPLDVIHRSPGHSMSSDYYVTLRKLIEKHGHDFPRIYTTTGDWNNRYPLWVQRLIWRTKLAYWTLLGIVRKPRQRVMKTISIC